KSCDFLSAGNWARGRRGQGERNATMDHRRCDNGRPLLGRIVDVTASAGPVGRSVCRPDRRRPGHRRGHAGSASACIPVSSLASVPLGLLSILLPSLPLLLPALCLLLPTVSLLPVLPAVGLGLAPPLVVRSI